MLYMNHKICKLGYDMTSMMKYIWFIVPGLLIAGLVALSFVGIPSPKVPVNKSIPIDSLLKNNEQSS